MGRSNDTGAGQGQSTLRPLRAVWGALAVTCLAGCGLFSVPPLPRPPQDASLDRVLVVLLDGVREDTFRKLLYRGDLPHLAALLEPDALGRRRAVYTPATSVWPSTTGPAYAPFVAGIFPGKSRLAGIRQYLRDQALFRSYAGPDASVIAQDLSREFPTIYEVLGREDTFNQTGFVSRRGWKDDGSAQRPLHENIASTPGFLHGLRGAAGEADLHNAISFLNYVSPQFDPARLAAAASFPGRFYTWNPSTSALRVGSEELFGLVGLERVVREQNLAARKLGHLPAYSFLSLHLPDGTAHDLGTGEAYEEAIQKTDEILGYVLEVLRRRGILDELTLIVSSDHGSAPVAEGPGSHFPLVERLAADTGLLIRDSVQATAGGFSLPWGAGGRAALLGPEPVGIAAVSGNANVQIYLRAPGAASFRARPSYADLRAYPDPTDRSRDPVDLVEALLRYSQVGLVFAADREQRRYHVFSQLGEGVMKVQRGERGAPEYRYQIADGEDPLGYESHPATALLLRSGDFHDGDAWAAASRDSEYPDGLVQIVQLLDCATSGDVIVDAAPGVEPWTQKQRGVHGALHRDQLVVPLLISSPRLDVEKAERLFARGRLPRTADVYPTVLDLLGYRPPRRISWTVSAPLGLYSVQREHPVRTDIDGRRLDIWSEAALDPHAYAVAKEGP